MTRRTIRRTLSTVLMGSVLALGAASAMAGERGQVSVSAPGVKAVVAGPVAFHAYSGFSGGAIYAAPLVDGTDSDCRAFPVEGTERRFRADGVIEFQVGVGEIACLAASRPFELLWHAQRTIPAPAPVMVAGTGDKTAR
jgi:hypothetical protein